MYDLIVSGGILALLYILFIKGYWYRGVLWMFGFVGLNDFLQAHIHPLTHTAIIMFDHQVSYSLVIAFGITVAAILTTKVRKQGE